MQNNSSNLPDHKPEIVEFFAILVFQVAIYKHSNLPQP